MMLILLIMIMLLILPTMVIMAAKATNASLAPLTPFLTGLFFLGSRLLFPPIASQPSAGAWGHLRVSDPHYNKHWNWER